MLYNRYTILFIIYINIFNVFNIQALGKVNFSAKIDFSSEGGLKIGEIQHIERIETVKSEEAYTDELDEIFNSVRLTRKQKELLRSNFPSLKQTYSLQGKKEFNLEYENINGLGRATGKALSAFFEKQSEFLS